MAMNSFTSWLYLLISLFVIGWAAFAEDITTGNLLPNGTNNASNYQSVDSSVPNVTTNGFNTTGNIRNWGQEIETTGTGGINVTGVITGTSFEGAFSGTGINIGIQSEGTTVSTATSTINFVPVNASLSVDQSDGVAGITTVTFQSSGISLGLAIALGA